jgi:hypothetical protein
MKESLPKEANSLWSVGTTLLGGAGDYDPIKLGYLLDALRDCAESCRQAGEHEWAVNLDDVATRLASRIKTAAAN